MPKELIESLRGKLTGEPIVEDYLARSSSMEVLETVWEKITTGLAKGNEDQDFSRLHTQSSRTLLEYWLFKAVKTQEFGWTDVALTIREDFEDEESLRVIKLEQRTVEESNEVKIVFRLSDDEGATPEFSRHFSFRTAIKSEIHRPDDNLDLAYKVIFIGDKISKITRTEHFNNLRAYQEGTVKRTETIDFGILAGF